MSPSDVDSESISLRTAEFLLCNEAQQAIAGLTSHDLSGDQTLPTLSALRTKFTREEAGALVTLARLRVRAGNKFPHAMHMYFTTQALEQATAWDVALHRAQWIHRHAPPGPVLDLGCGIGGDALALATYRNVIAFERDPVRLRFARANAVAAAVADHIEFRNLDWRAELSGGRLPEAVGAFADPSRRVAGRRVFSLHEVEPPLPVLLTLSERTPNLALKVMPGVKAEEVPAHCGVEFISHEGVCKEAVLWFGAFAQYNRWASVQSAGGWHRLVAEEKKPPVGELKPEMILYEPDPAVIRAGAFWELCELLDAHLIDPRIAYLASDTRRETPFAAAFQVLEVHPFHLRQLNKRLQALGIRDVELKKRGAPFEPESLRPRLRLPDRGTSGVVLFTRVESTPTMIIARRV